MNITFIGNCQMLSLCFYFQQLLPESTISWCLYGDEFRPHVVKYSDKCKNKILDFDKSIEQIKQSQIILYQEIAKEKSPFSNSITLHELAPTAQFIKLPSIYLEYAKYDTSIIELEKRELEKEVDIKVSEIFNKYRTQTLMLTVFHPNTFLFLEVVKEICERLKIDYFSEDQRKRFLEKNNYMELP